MVEAGLSENAPEPSLPDSIQNHINRSIGAQDWTRLLLADGLDRSMVGNRSDHQVHSCKTLLGAGASAVGTSRRFAPEFRQEYAQWEGYWDKQATPQQEHVPDVRARLGHLFGLGAGEP